jgi:multimeric flavodoxin WrbA
MRVATILGSPRRHGNTAKVLQWIEGQLRADGHEIDHVDIIDYDVGGCRECLACKKGGKNGPELCLLDDDANGLFRRMAQADLILLAAPVFCWGFPAQIKGLVDRFFCLMDFDEPRTDVPRLNGKPISLLMTGGGEQIDNADLVFRGFAHMVRLLRAHAASNWYVANCSTPEALGEDIHREAIEFAKRLCGEVAS